MKNPQIHSVANKELFEVSGNDYYKELRKLSKKLIGRSVEVVYKDQVGVRAPPTF